jgi:hypothetical protein
MATAPMSAHGWWMVVSGTDEQAGVFHVVEPGHPNIAGHRNPKGIERLQELGGGEVVGAHEPVRAGVVQHAFHFRPVFLVDSEDVRLGLPPARASRYPQMRASTVGAERGRPTKASRRQPRLRRCEVMV